MSIQILTLEKMYWVALQALVIFFIIIITGLVARLSRYLVARLLRHRAPGVAMPMQQVIFWFIWFIGAVFAISQTGFSLNVVLIVTALVGLAIVISLRDITRSLFARMALDLYPLYKIGDEVKMKQYSGKVIDINFLSTTLLSEEDELIHIPTSLFLRNVTVNLSSTASHEASIPIVVDSTIDIMEFERNLLYLCKQYKKEFVRGTKPTIVTSASNKDMNELTLILNLKNPEKRGIIIQELKEKIKRLIDDMS